jgi:very-short-patch-repair endonuclease
VAAVASVAELRAAVAEAEVRRVLDPVALRELIARSRGRRGVARLRMTLEELDPKTRRTRSELERALLRLCRRAELPEPQVNVLLDLGDVKIEADLLWRTPKLILEADSRAFHDTASAFEADRRRDQLITAAGWRVIRCTWRQVFNEPARLARVLRTLLTADGPKSEVRLNKSARRR